MKGRSHHLQSSNTHEDWVDESWTVDCVCGVNFDDGEEMVNCDECGVWVHTRCSRYVKGDDLFTCDKCKNKNNRNNDSETEVAQLLVELPTKTLRMESGHAVNNGHVRRPFRLWTDIPMEERVHVQGIPGGDPALFGGLSSIFTQQLWKCSGYVPKKFKLQYKEFSCWDHEEGDAKNKEENENPVDKGAGVLFSLSKESVLATPVGALVGMKGRDEEGACGEFNLKGMKKWEGDVGRSGSQIGVQKESPLLPPFVLHSGKQKKEDLGASKDRSGKKKVRVAVKEADAKRRVAHACKAVFTPTSDAKPLDFYEDRGLKFSKADSLGTKNKSSRDTVIPESLSDSYLGLDNGVEKPKSNLEHASEALSSDMSRHNFLSGVGLKEEKAGHQVPVAIEGSPKLDAVTASLVEHHDPGGITVKAEGDGMAVDKLDDSVKSSARCDVKAPTEDPFGAAPDDKGNQALQNFNGDTFTSSVQSNFNEKEGGDDNSREILNFESPPNEAKHDDHASENSKLNDSVVSTSPSSDQKVRAVERTSEAVSDCHTDKADELSGDCHMDKADALSDDPSQLKRVLEGSEGSMAMQKFSSELKHGPGTTEEYSKLGGVALNSLAPYSQCKMVVCVGKSSSNSSSAVFSRASTSDNPRTGGTQSSNPTTKQQVMSDCNISIMKDRAASDVVRDEDRHDRKTSKERPKSFSTSTSKALHASKISHTSVVRRTVSESKDSVDHSSSKVSSMQNTAVTSGSGESVGLLQNQSTSLRGEKSNQSNAHAQPSSKANHGPSMHPPAASNSPATLSDEELALLLHQELNSSPRVPRVPRVRHAGSLPQLASPTATSMLIKRSSSSGGKDHGLVSKRKTKDAPKDGFRRSHEPDNEGRKMDRVPSSPDQRRHDIGYKVDSSSKREETESPTAVHSLKKNITPAVTATVHSGPFSSTEVDDHNLLSARNSPRNVSDDDIGTARGPVHRTLPGLINEIMSKGRRMTYEELCNAVLPHWHNLRKHNGERYAYSSHSQAVLDCLRNRIEWAQLVDRGPKTNSSRKRRKLDAEESEDNEYSKGRSAKDLEGKSLESQREEFPKGKRKARKRRRLALQGRGVKDIRKRRKADLLSDDDMGPFSNSSEESLFSDDEIQEGGAGPVGSEVSASSDDIGAA